jgi:hypothetical protein
MKEFLQALMSRVPLAIFLVGIFLVILAAFGQVPVGSNVLQIKSQIWQIVLAVIGVCLLTTGLVLVFSELETKLFSMRSSKSLPKDRRQAIVGKWVGLVNQEEGPDGKPIQFTITIDIKISGRILRGDLQFNFNRLDLSFASDYHYEGGFVNDRHLQINYISKNKGIIAFGCIIL